MPFQPFSDRVLVRRHEAASTDTSGGLTVPDSAKEKPQEGTVIYAGPGYLSDRGIRTPLQCHAGDHIFFGKHAGAEINVEGEKVLILHEAEILGKLVGAVVEHLSPLSEQETLNEILAQHKKESDIG